MQRQQPEHLGCIEYNFCCTKFAVQGYTRVSPEFVLVYVGFLWIFVKLSLYLRIVWYESRSLCFFGSIDCWKGSAARAFLH